MQSIHPLTKLSFTIFIVAAAVLLGLIPQLVVVGVLLILSLAAGQRRVIARRFFRYILPVVALILLLNVLFYPESRETVSVLGVRVNEAGLQFGVRVSIRLVVLSLALLLFFTTTPMAELGTALIMKGAHPRIVYILLHSIQLVETLRRKIKKITIAQEARGLRLRGNPLKRVQAFLKMLFPLIFSYVSESVERGLALELRGFGIHGPKSFLHEVRESSVERAAGRVFILGTVLIILWKIVQWLSR
jgi:energy-coupling factor transport system permease protein